MKRFDFKGKVAVVTGAARGVGLAITERLLDDRAAVSLWDADRPALQAQRLGARELKGERSKLKAGRAAFTFALSPFRLS